MEEQAERAQQGSRNNVAEQRLAGVDTNREDEKLPFDGMYGFPITIVAPNETIGISMEYDYVEKVLGQRGVDWEKEFQALLRDDDGRMYDLLVIRLKDGRQRQFLFDISGWFGKFDIPFLTFLLWQLDRELANKGEDKTDDSPETD